MNFIGIDPSTKSGFVMLDERGEVVIDKELYGEGKEDPARMVTLVDKILDRLPSDRTKLVICIESPSNHSTGCYVSQMFGLAWLLRGELYRKGIKYVDVTPSQLKKFATGKGNAKKDAMVLPIHKTWNFENNSDNVRDAYVLAQIAKGLHTRQAERAYQAEVIRTILNPVDKTKKSKTKGA